MADSQFALLAWQRARNRTVPLMLTRNDQAKQSVASSSSASAAAPRARIPVLFHIVDFGDGGIESALISWLRVFDRKRFAVTLSVMFTSPAYETRFKALIPADVPIEILADKPWLNYFQARRYAKRLSKLGRLGRDVFNTLVVRPYVKERLAALARRFHIIVDFDMSLRRIAGEFDVAWLGVNHFSFDARLGSRPRKRRRLMTQFARYDSIAALNQHMADEAAVMFGDNLRNVFVLPNAIDIARIRERASIVEARPCSAPYIVSVARLDEVQKDHRTLLRAYARLVRERAVTEDLVIVGDGANRGELEALAKELGIAARVHFQGYRNNPHPLIAGAQMHVLSSRYEGLPMVLLEALALGKAVVASDCPTGPREMLDEGRYGLLVPVGDEAALADAIWRVLSDDALRDGLKQRSHERATFYGIEASNVRLDECLSGMLARRLEAIAPA
jgi:glycosyltransferase involved in cell wall biosynthesis